MRDPYLPRIEFTASQVVTIVIALALAAILFPIGVRAATGSAVNITDPASAGRVAKVSGFGDLRTLTCDTSVNQCAGVAAYAQRVVTYPGSAMSRRLSRTSTSVGSLSGPHTAATKLVTGSFTFVNLGTADLTGRIFSALDSTCDGTGYGNASTVAHMSAKAGETVHLSYPVPLVVTRTGTYCLYAALDTAPAGAELWFEMAGFTA